MTNPLDNILHQADHCVKCGLCLPHCPTYAINHDENESPRGRIALMQGLASEQLSINKTLQAHLDHCLGCRRCERVCPSAVNYGTMLDETRNWLAQQRPKTGFLHNFAQLGFKLLVQRNWQNITYTLLRFYQLSGLQLLVRHSGLLHPLRLNRLERLLPTLPKRTILHDEYPAAVNTQGRVALFTGCMSPLLDQGTVLGSIRILNLLGYDVLVPQQQTCCGALHLHQGQQQQASELARQNIQTFGTDAPVVYLATGCGSQLAEYDKLPWPGDKQLMAAQSFARQAVEITEFIARHDLQSLTVHALNETVAIHSPCSAGKHNSVRHILEHIPDLKLIAMQPTSCCGAAGSYMLTQHKLATRIRDRTIGQISATSARIITTTNIGCAIHIKVGLPASAKVMHPIELFVMQLEKNT